MSSKGGGVIVVVSGEDKTGEVFNAIKKHLDETEAKAKEASSSLEGIGQSLMQGLQYAGITVGIGEVVNGLKEMVTSTMEAGVQIGKLHQQTGISTESLSVLKYAAAASGVEFETVAKSGKKLAEAIHETDAGKLSEGFKILGISAEEVKLKGNDMYGVMELVADKFQQMPDGIEKNVAAVKLFGRAGQDMIPILNQGSEALEKMKSEAPIFSDEDLKKMEDMHHALNDLDAAWKRLSLTITGTAAPAITAYVNDFSEGMDTIIASAKDMWHWLSDDGKHPLDDYLAQLHAAQNLIKAITPPSTTNPGLHGGSGGGGKSGGGGSAAKSQPFTVDTEALEEQSEIDASNTQRAVDALDKSDADAIAAWDKFIADTNAAQAKAIAAVLQFTAPKVSLAAAAPKAADYSSIDNEAEKFAHGLFDPLFNLGEKWNQQWKQIRANMLKDLGQAAESQLFGELFGDPEGRGGKGWNGGSFHGDTSKPGSGRTGLASEALGGLMGLFQRKSSPVSNGTGNAGAGTVLSSVAGALQVGKGGGSGSGGVQVILNNMGTPQQVDSTQQSGGQAEAMILQVILKDQQTNGAITQGFSSLFSH